MGQQGSKGSPRSRAPRAESTGFSLFASGGGLDPSATQPVPARVVRVAEGELPAPALTLPPAPSPSGSKEGGFEKEKSSEHTLLLLPPMAPYRPWENVQLLPWPEGSF